jgi:hypothetical protein
VFTGRLSADYALDLIAGLISEPGSRWRAQWMREHPDEIGKGDGLQFLGFSQDSSLLLAIHNAIVSFAGKAAKDAFLHPPTVKTARLFAKTIAEFDVNAFMALPGAIR